MGKNIVARTESHRRGRNVNSILRKQKSKTDCLSNRSFTASVGTCENVNPLIVVKHKFVCDDIYIIALNVFYSQLYIVKIFNIAVSFLFRCNLRLAERKIFLHNLVAKLGKTNVKNNFGHQRNKGIAVDVYVLVKR